MGLAHSPRIVTDGLVLCLDAASKRSYPGTGTTWTDLKGGNNGALQNGPTFDADNGGSIVFDGSNDVVNCGPTNNIIGNNPAAISLSVWFNTSSTSRMYAASFKRYNTQSTLLSITINQQDNGALGANDVANHLGFLYDVDSGHKWVTVNNSTFYGKWNQITATVDVNAATLYLNGVQAGQNTSQTFAGPSRGDPSADFTLGSFGTQFYLNGNISQAHAYNKVLTADEVRQNYLATKERYS